VGGRHSQRQPPTAQGAPLLRAQLIDQALVGVGAGGAPLAAAVRAAQNSAVAGNLERGPAGELPNLHPAGREDNSDDRLLEVGRFASGLGAREPGHAARLVANFICARCGQLWLWLLSGL
jgi:hypothetical protein